ncbi:MAG: nitroreductase family protein [Clostridia bacterium]
MIFNSIMKRTSTRTFLDEPMSEQSLELIKDSIALVNGETGPNGNHIVFCLLDRTPRGKRTPAGTYGFIRNAQAYVSAAVPNNDGALEDFGYLLEKIIITLVPGGIGSCWLGGTFKRDDFTGSLKPDAGSIIPAVIPIGYPETERRGMEKAMRIVVKADNKKNWRDLFYLEDFSQTLDPDLHHEVMGRLCDSFEAVRLGPSASNKQPWRLVFDPSGRKIHFYLFEDHLYSGNKLGFSMQRIDAGIAMYHFGAVASENGFPGTWSSLDPGIGKIPQYLKYIKTYVY